jgi:DASH complex subunit DAD4
LWGWGLFGRRVPGPLHQQQQQNTKKGQPDLTVTAMESPHEHQQNLLLSRIITNVEKLNESIVVMNKTLQDINIQNMNIELVAQMFKNYQSNVLFHLEATDNLKDPV